MSQLQTSLQPEVIYPDSDGQPMADNTEQFRWIVFIQQNLESLFADDPNVFVAGDLLWYPVEGDNKTRVAPDALVALGRPKGYRGSYQQWQEGNIAPQVVFEVLSPGNTQREMHKKLRFYERYGVEEYYLYDPDRNDLSGWQRQGDRLELIDPIDDWISPRLRIRFHLAEPELQLFRPNGEPFTTLDQERQKVAQERQRTEQERQRTEQERQRTEQERQRAEQAEQRAARLAERLRAAGIKPDNLE